MIALFLLAVSAGAQDSSITALIQQLKSDSIETREEAARKLIELGPKALGLIEKALKEEPDSRELASIASEIQRRERIRVLRPIATKQDVRVSDLPASLASRQVLEQYDAHLTWSPRLPDRKITINLKQASIWQAIDAIQSESKANVTWGKDLGFTDTEDEYSPMNYDCGDTRLCLRYIGLISNQGILKPSWSLAAYSAPGTFVCGSRADFEILDETERKISGEIVQTDLLRRLPKSPSFLQSCQLQFLSADLKKSKTLRIRGSVILKCPKDIARREIDASTGGTIQFDKCRITVEPIKKANTYVWEFRCSIGETDEPFQALVTLENKEGDWLCDVRTIASAGTGGSGHNARIQLLEAVPAKIVVYEILGHEETRLNVDFKDVRIPQQK